jgi:hypothetical protein
VVTQILEVLIYDFFILKIKSFANGIFHIDQVERHKA